MSRVIAAYDLDEDHGRLWVNADLKRMPEVVIVANQPMDRAQTVTYVPEARLLEAIDENRRVEAENAKLRELIHVLCYCMHDEDCDGCRLNGERGEIVADPLYACDGLHELLREFGIEVDE